MEGGLDSSVLREINGGLWHTTLPCRFEQILQSGAILPEPDISGFRYGTKYGKKSWPYVRSIGGVSLFEFNNFDSDSYDKLIPGSIWSAFIPYQPLHKIAIWIEINRELVSENYISAEMLLLRWKKERSSRRIMAMIEAAHIGPVFTSTFKRAFVVSEDDKQIREFSLT